MRTRRTYPLLAILSHETEVRYRRGSWSLKPYLLLKNSKLNDNELINKLKYKVDVISNIENIFVIWNIKICFYEKKLDCILILY